MQDSDFNVSDKTSKYIKVEDGYVIEQDGKVVLYSESISGASRSSNYIWVILLLLFGSNSYILCSQLPLLKQIK